MSGIDILMATHNGERTLAVMIEALAKLTPPKRQWRLIAVDNASTDATSTILEAAASRLPIVKLTCSTPGKMAALRVGAGQVTGDLVVFTDDDVAPEPDWLLALEEAADRAPDAGVFGGRIRPQPMGRVGPWFEASVDRHAELFALTDQPDGPVDATMHVFGPNFLLRREHLGVLGEVGLEIGPNFQRPQTYAMGQDAQILETLCRRGVKANFVRSAAVNHLVRENQTELSYMLARAERHGLGTAIQSISSAPNPARRRAKLVLEHLVRGVQPTMAGAPSRERFNELWNVRWSRGAVLGALRLQAG